MDQTVVKCKPAHRDMHPSRPRDLIAIRLWEPPPYRYIHDTLFMPDSGMARADFPGGSAEALPNFLQEDAPSEVGEATARFVAKVLAGQIS